MTDAKINLELNRIEGGCHHKWEKLDGEHTDKSLITWIGWQCMGECETIIQRDLQDGPPPAVPDCLNDPAWLRGAIEKYRIKINWHDNKGFPIRCRVRVPGLIREDGRSIPIINESLRHAVALAVIKANPTTEEKVRRMEVEAEFAWR